MIWYCHLKTFVTILWLILLAAFYLSQHRCHMFLEDFLDLPRLLGTFLPTPIATGIYPYYRIYSTALHISFSLREEDKKCY